MTESELLEVLKILFPSRIIYINQRKSSPNNIKLFSLVRKFAKINGVSSDDWLASKGYICLDVGSSKSDMPSEQKKAPENRDETMMEYRFSERTGESAFDLADWILKNYPLAGE
ncbi:MAG: hypothetical protein R3Y07_09705, partial [Eubacteriales bacterium]